MYLGPSWPRRCRFIVMIHWFNSFSGAIRNTRKTRYKHDDNRPAAGPKQPGSTGATHHRNTRRSRNPESVAFLEHFCGWPQSEGASIIFAGRVERAETSPGASVRFNLDLASVQAIHAKGDRRPAPPTRRLPEGSMPTSEQPGGATVVVSLLKTSYRTESLVFAPNAG